jgi:hypothetical protein
MSAGEGSILPEFLYEPLLSTTSIRLLNLQLVNRDDYGQLDTYPLDKAPLFVALSYTWGCPFSSPNYELDDAADTSAINSQ